MTPTNKVVTKELDRRQREGDIKVGETEKQETTFLAGQFLDRRRPLVQQEKGKKKGRYTCLSVTAEDEARKASSRVGDIEVKK